MLLHRLLDLALEALLLLVNKAVEMLEHIVHLFRQVEQVLVGLLLPLVELLSLKLDSLLDVVDLAETP